MRLYRIVKRDGAWYVIGGEPEHSIASSDQRDQLMQLARRIAARHKGELYVYDEKFKLELRLPVHRWRRMPASTPH